MYMMYAVSVLVVYMGVWTVQSQTVIQHLDHFTRNTDIDGKMCKDSDVAFQDTPLSLVSCAGRCRTTVGCSGFMYNRMKSSCVCCRGEYTVETTLDTEVGTQYFEGEWWNFNGIFFKLAAETMKFNDAVKYCKLNGGFVVRADSNGKRQFLANMLSIIRKDYWIGITDKDHEGTWTWTNDGSEANNTNWNIGNGMPNGIGNCARTNINYGYQWADVHCFNYQHVLCEREW